MALLELTDVEARYGPVRALHGVSLAVDEGQIVAVLGANGAGKTTTLRAISGTVKRTGEIVYDGGSLGRRGPEAVARLGVAHVPEGRGTFAELSVVENLRLGAYTRRGSLDGDIKRMSGYFPWIGERLEQHAGTLSGGEQQMLALARALMSRPRLLLLDEPSLGLAPLVTREIFRIVRELNEEEGLTVLVVEQNAAIALEVASHAYVLEVGKVAVSGTSEELARDESVRKSLPGLLMAEFFQQVVAGLGAGAIYASLALALVLIHRATGVINFAQGEMAMFTTYIAWTLIENHGWPYWPAFVATLVFAFVLGLGIQRVVIAPVSDTSVLTVVIMTIGLVLTFNGLASLIWSAEIRAFPSPFPNETWQIGERLDLAAGRRHVRDRPRARRPAVGVLPVHEDGPRPACVGAQPGGQPPRRSPGGLDARDRLGPGRDARRGGGNARRPDPLPRPEHDAGHADLRVRGRGARRDRLAVRRRRRRRHPRRRAEPDQQLRRLRRRRPAAAGGAPRSS